MKSTILKYGVYGFLTGLIVFTLHLVLGIENLDYGTNEILGYISIFISLSFIYFGIKHYRDNVNNGIISLGKAITIGTLISLMVGIGIGIADFIYTEFINPDFFKSYEDMLIKQGREAEIIEMTSTTAALFMIVLVSIIGFIISLLSALFLQRK
ncbi:DUF4199 domain-containing protein [Tenacibaculum aiptasiae]|uniref:DUF4199 domain-containing protein n=1 Tax=Tenacibaculum aiptasiae TaxID=426481 RepID=A0A7J5AT77_9FLAO|nr:DUF4199 domain-containing protein [Tenacibaculum aiptasiae]KAB1160749.1 DUF4199 domain-containing protein [Tenacibaculum aiptasiae]